MDKLESLIKSFDEAYQEYEILALKRTEAQAAKEEALNSVAAGKIDLNDSKLARMVADAQFQLDLVAARWGAVERLLKKGEREVYDEWQAQARLMRKWFKAKRAEMELELQKVLEPFCEPGSTKAKRLADDLSGELFVFRQLFRRIPTNGPDEIVPRPDTATVLLGAKIFLRKAKAVVKEYGISN